MNRVRALCLLSLASFGCAAQNQPVIFDDFDTGVIEDDAVAKDDLPAQPEVLAFDIPSLDVQSVDAAPVDGPSVDAATGETGTPDDAQVEDTGPRPDVCRLVCGTVCVDTETDPRNCGRCGNDCTALPGVDASRVTCERGVCNLRNACMDGRLNCTGNPSTGCETAVTTAFRCGSCVTGCTEPTPLCGVMTGAPTGYACLSGCTAPLSARCSGVCVNTDTDPRNCGTCGTVCPTTTVANGRGGCEMGACALVCNVGFGDCDGNPANGCETRTTNSITNCGACGTVCTAPPGGTPSCVNGVCTITCAAGTGDCDRMGSNGCEVNLRTDSTNCGACGTTCEGRPNTAGTCNNGACAFACNPGFGNCDNNFTNGCEAELAANPLNCGACGFRCASAANATASCAGSVCGITCNAGFGNCDGNGLNGCEANTATNTQNCGACGNVCPSAPGASAVCTAGRCGLACMPGSGDCDMNASNGCEVNLNTSNAHCGMCGSICNAISNSTAQCVAGACQITCNDGFELNAGICVRSPPRAVSPAPFSFVTSRRPLFRIALPAGQDGATIDICADRACTAVATSFTITGRSGQATTELAPGIYYWRTRGRLAGAIVTGLGVSQEFMVVASGSPTASASWGSFLDANADGSADLLAGAPGTGSPAPQARFWRSIATVAGATPFNTSNTTVALGTSGAGNAVAAIGDVNGDGLGDSAVAASAGNQVQIFHGTTSGISTSPATSLTQSGIVGFGTSVAAAGDVNGDGYGDVIVGASSSNRAFVFLGSATGLNSLSARTLTPSAGSANFGVSVAGVGDVNADGYADVMVGTDGPNIAYLYMGSSTGVSTTAIVLAAPSGASGFGRSLAPAGDVNADGYPDVVVGAFSSGVAFIYHGGGAGLSTGPNAVLSGMGALNFGLIVDGLGDINGDGYNDVLVGAPFIGTSGNGTGYIFRGGASGITLSSPITFVIPGAGGQATRAAGLGDTNRDGLCDFAVGNPITSTAASIQVWVGVRDGSPRLANTLTATSTIGTSIASLPQRLRGALFAALAPRGRGYF
ncbi:MAG: FG-GAP-like repeat-containing protein [Polyangiales bacterium]